MSHETRIVGPTRGKTWLFTILPLVIFLLLVILSGLVRFRADTTEDKVFTISKVSRNLFQELEDPVSITYVVSGRLTREIPEIQHIIDILQEYGRYGGTRLNLRVVDPEEDQEFSSPEQLGIQPQQYQVIEENEQRVAQVYTGIIISYRDQQSLIPAIADPGSLEYQVTTAIRDLTRGQKRSVGILTDGQPAMAEEEFGYLYQELSRIAEVRSLTPGERIPETLDALFVLGGAGFDQGALYQIDQFIMAGKGVFWAVDPISVNLESNLQPEDGSDAPVFQILGSYGIEVSPQWVLDRSNLPIPVQQVQGAMRINTYEAYPLWVQTTQGAPDHPITARFAGLDLFWASPISFDSQKNPDGSFEPLVFSSDRTALMDQPVQTNPVQVGYLSSTFQEQQQVLAGVLTGGVSSYFPGDPRGENPSHRGSTDNARLVVVGDGDFLTSLIQIHRSTQNLQFALSAFEWLGHDEEMLNLRTRQIRNTRLDAIQDPELRSASMNWAKTLGIGAAPLILLILGIIRFISRRRRANQ